MFFSFCFFFFFFTHHIQYILFSRFFLAFNKVDLMMFWFIACKGVKGVISLFSKIYIYLYVKRE